MSSPHISTSTTARWKASAIASFPPLACNTIPKRPPARTIAVIYLKSSENLWGRFAATRSEAQGSALSRLAYWRKGSPLGRIDPCRVRLPPNVAVLGDSSSRECLPMIRQFACFACVVMVLTVAAMVAQPSRGSSQQKKVPTDPAAQQAGDKAATSAQKLLQMSDTLIETKTLAKMPLSLKDCLYVLHDRFQKRGQAFPILVDVEAFKVENPDMPDPYETIIEFPPVPEEISIGDFLRHVVSKVPTKNATFVVLHDHILITTHERTTVAAKLNERVRGIFENRPLSSVLREISEKVGTTIVIDNRAADKAKTEVSVTFLNDTPLAGALRVLTEMADLKVLVLDGAILVTTPAHYELLRKEHRGKMQEHAPPVVGGFGVPAGQGLPGSPGIAEPFVDPLWPYVPMPPGSRRDAR